MNEKERKKETKVYSIKVDADSQYGKEIFEKFLDDAATRIAADTISDTVRYFTKCLEHAIKEFGPQDGVMAAVESTILWALQHTETKLAVCVGMCRAILGDEEMAKNLLKTIEKVPEQVRVKSENMTPESFKNFKEKLGKEDPDGKA